MTDGSKEDHQMDSEMKQHCTNADVESNLSRDLDVAGAVTCNSYGETCEDVALAELKVRWLFRN